MFLACLRTRLRTPAVSSSGTGNGIVWIVQSNNTGASAILRAYNATDLSVELYNSQENPSRDNPGDAVKFVVPTIADGHVFVGAQNQVAMYGLLQESAGPSTVPLTMSRGPRLDELRSVSRTSQVATER